MTVTVEMRETRHRGIIDLMKVEFQEEQNDPTISFARQQKIRGITAIVMKLGAKDKKQANIYMVLIIIICLAVTVFIIRPSQEAMLQFSPNLIERMPQGQQIEP